MFSSTSFQQESLFLTSINNHNLSNSQDPESCCSLWHQRRLSYWNQLSRMNSNLESIWRTSSTRVFVTWTCMWGMQIDQESRFLSFDRWTWGCWCSCCYRGAYGRRGGQNRWPCGIEMGGLQAFARRKSLVIACEIGDERYPRREMCLQGNYCSRASFCKSQ